MVTHKDEKIGGLEEILRINDSHTGFIFSHIHTRSLVDFVKVILVPKWHNSMDFVLLFCHVKYLESGFS